MIEAGTVSTHFQVPTSHFKCIKNVMTKKPVSVENDTLAVKALRIMNEKKITSLCVHHKKKYNKTIGLIHIHHLLESNIE